MRYIGLTCTILLFLTACVISRAENQVQLAKDVQEVVASREESLTLTEYGDWKAINLFGPYTPDEMVDESLGMKFRGPSVGMSEMHFLLVLVDEKDSVQYALLPRSVLKADARGEGHESYIYVDYSLDREKGEINIKYLPW